MDDAEYQGHGETSQNMLGDIDALSRNMPNSNMSQERSNQTSVPERNLHDLFHPPRSIHEMRQRLFQVSNKIELQPHEFDLYWPYVDNVWVRQHRAGMDRSGRLTTDYYACRLQRPTYTPKEASKSRPEGKPSRKKQIREGGTCQMRIKTVRFSGGYNAVTIQPVGDQIQHSHDLDHMDRIKRTTVLMEIARSEVMKGYMPASVFSVMSEDIEKLSISGGRFFSRNDVRNASQAWRQNHREELRVHEGYKYDHGNGIVREEGTIAFSNRSGGLQSVDPSLKCYGSTPPNTLQFPIEMRSFLEPYLPAEVLSLDNCGLPHVTLTYATSMDSCLSLAPGLQTVISGLQTKAMTHYLRSRHDAILVGVRTALADNPALNCRLEGAGGYGGFGWEGQPRPVVIDPRARWQLSPRSKVLETVQEGKGRGPWIIISPGFHLDPSRPELLKSYGGKYLGLTEVDQERKLRWEAILKALASEGIRSVMIEGGGTVINDLLQPENTGYVSSVVVTVAPTYLGRGGVTVSPAPIQDHLGQPRPAVRFHDVKWQPLGEDVVMCGRLPAVDSIAQLPSSALPVPPTQLIPLSSNQSQANGQHLFGFPVDS